MTKKQVFDSASKTIVPQRVLLRFNLTVRLETVGCRPARDNAFAMVFLILQTRKRNPVGMDIRGHAEKRKHLSDTE